MIRLPRWSLAALLAVATLVGLLVRAPGRELSAGTYGVLPTAYGALYELLVELQVPVQRSHALSAALPPAATVWWIAPPSLCRDGRAGWQAGDWVERGGTAVLLLPPSATCPLAEAVAEVALPTRTAERRSVEGQAIPAGEAPARRWDEQPADHDQVLTGDLIGRPRDLLSPGLQAFVDAGTWQVQAALDGLPFVLETVHGKGRLVVVADARVLSNAVLDRGDNAVFAMDLVRAYDAPFIDELEHGMQPSGGTVSYLLASPALPLLIGMCLLAGLYAWNGQTLPPRAHVPAAAPPPSLGAFVDSLAALYSSSGDHQRIWQAYRELALGRLRRYFGIAADVEPMRVIERLAEQRRLAPALVAMLRDARRMRDAAELRRAVVELDGWVEEAMQK